MIIWCHHLVMDMQKKVPLHNVDTNTLFTELVEVDDIVTGVTFSKSIQNKFELAFNFLSTAHISPPDDNKSDPYFSIMINSTEHFHSEATSGYKAVSYFSSNIFQF